MQTDGRGLRAVDNNEENGGHFNIGNKLKDFQKLTPSRRLEFEQYLREVGEELAKTIDPEQLKNIKDKGLETVKYMAMRKLVSLMFPVAPVTQQKNALALQAIECAFSRMYPKMQNMEITAEINHRHHLEIPQSKMDTLLDKVLVDERSRFKDAG